MPDDLDQKRTEFIVKEAVHRADVISYAETSLSSLPEEDEEQHARQRKRLLEQADHYKKMYDGIVKAVQDDRERME